MQHVLIQKDQDSYLMTLSHQKALREEHIGLLMTLNTLLFIILMKLTNTLKTLYSTLKLILKWKYKVLKMTQQWNRVIKVVRMKIFNKVKMNHLNLLLIRLSKNINNTLIFHMIVQCLIISLVLPYSSLNKIVTTLI